jgi:methionine-R-sulfoxide reductase
MSDDSNSEWKEKLTPEQYYVLREKGTEKPFSGEYVDFDETGEYTCAGCGSMLFTSDNKFESGCGWPSFDDVVNSDAVITENDDSLGMHRVEVLCRQCGGHLGHVFPDGPQETTGIRYCINSTALHFRKKDSS